MKKYVITRDTKIICSNCRYEGFPRMAFSKCSIVIFVLTFIISPIIALIYYLICSRSYYVCPKCGSKEIYPIDSSEGMRVYRDLYFREKL